MKTLINALILGLILAVTPFKAVATDAFSLRMGTDLTHYKDQTSIYSLGYETFDRHGWGAKIEGGGWTDIADDRRCSPFGAVLVGKQFGDYRGLNLTGLVGAGIIGAPDAALSTTFQFTEEVTVGYDVVGLGFKHFSNAGIKEPNQGRDYFFVNLAFPW
jgi:hypothetical protein